MYIHKTNWFVRPEEATLESLVSALKMHALRLLSAQERAAKLHRSILVRSTGSWFSSMTARLIAAVGSVCLTQPAARRRRGDAWSVNMLRPHKHAKLQSLFAASEKERIFIATSETLPLFPKSMPMRDAVKEKEKYQLALKQFPQNLFGLCRMPVSSARPNFIAVQCTHLSPGSST